MGSKENLRLTITRNTCLTPFESFINNRDDSTDCVAITGKACFYFVESFYTIECHPRTPATNVKCQFPSKAPVCSSRFYTIILKCVRNIQYLKCIWLYSLSSAWRPFSMSDHGTVLEKPVLCWPYRNFECHQSTTSALSYKALYCFGSYLRSRWHGKDSSGLELCSCRGTGIWNNLLGSCRGPDQVGQQLRKFFSSTRLDQTY